MLTPAKPGNLRKFILKEACTTYLLLLSTGTSHCLTSKTDGVRLVETQPSGVLELRNDGNGHSIGQITLLDRSQ